MKIISSFEVRCKMATPAQWRGEESRNDRYVEPYENKLTYVLSGRFQGENEQEAIDLAANMLVSQGPTFSQEASYGRYDAYENAVQFFDCNDEWLCVFYDFVAQA